MRKNDYHFWKRKDFIYFQQKANERIRALEAELGRYREGYPWSLWEREAKAERVRAEKAEAERDALASLNESKNTTIDALKARVAELERAPLSKNDTGSSLSHEEYHGWYGEPCNCKGGGRESGKAEARAGAVRRDNPEAARDRSAAADPAACPYCGQLPGQPHLIAEVNDKECGG